MGGGQTGPLSRGPSGLPRSGKSGKEGSTSVETTGTLSLRPQSAGADRLPDERRLGPGEVDRPPGLGGNNQGALPAGMERLGNELGAHLVLSCGSGVLCLREGGKEHTLQGEAGLAGPEVRGRRVAPQGEVVKFP